MCHGFFFLGSWDNITRVNNHLRKSILFTSEKASMTSRSDALKATKGRAVASLFRKAQENLKLRNLLKCGGVALISLMFAHPVLAAGTDLLSSQNTTVNATFGSGSSIVKWFYLAEILFGIFIYIKTRSPLTFIGIPILIIATRVGFAIAS